MGKLGEKQGLFLRRLQPDIQERVKFLLGEGVRVKQIRHSGITRPMSQDAWWLLAKRMIDGHRRSSAA